MTENLALINIEQQLRLLGEKLEGFGLPTRTTEESSSRQRPTSRFWRTKPTNSQQEAARRRHLGRHLYIRVTAFVQWRSRCWEDLRVQGYLRSNACLVSVSAVCPLGADETRRAPALLLPERRTLRTQSRRSVDKGLHSSTHLSLPKSNFTSASSLSSTK